MGYNRRSTSMTHRPSHGVKNGIASLSHKTHASSNKTKNRSALLDYMAYCRFGMLKNIGLNVLAIPNSQVNTEQKLQFLIMLDYIFGSQQSAVVLNAIKQARELATQRRAVNMSVMAEYKKEGDFKRYEMERSIDNHIAALSPNELKPLADYAQKQSFLKRGLKNISKYAASIVIATTLITGSLYTQDVQAQAQTDTSWATGWFEVMEKNSPNLISNHLDVYMIPLNVQQSNPDTIKDVMGGSGYYPFNLPIHIDTTVGINTSTPKLNSKVYPSFGSEMNVILDEESEGGEILFFDQKGSEIIRLKFNGNRLKLNLGNLKNGLYFYHIITSKGQTSGKYIKIGAGNYSNGLMNHQSYISMENYSALQNIQTQTKISSNADTTFATGLFHVVNKNTNFGIPNYLDIQMIPLNVQQYNPDTIVDNMGGTSGMYQFNLPIYIDTTVNINESLKPLESLVFPTYGAELNIQLKEQVYQGLLVLFDNNGKQVMQQSFSGKSVYMAFPHLANGTYFYQLQTEKGINSGKFIKLGSDVSGQSMLTQNPSNDNNPTARIAAGSFNADYKIILRDPNIGPGVGFHDLDTIINLTDGDNGLINLQMTPVDPLTVDLVVNIWDLMGDSIKDAFVYIQNSSGQIDSLRTDSTGKVSFDDLTQGTTYTAGVGGVKDHKNWEGFSINIPNISTYQDTILNKNYTLIPDSIFSGRNNVMVGLTNLEIADMFGKYNIQASLDTTRIYISTTFTPTKYNNILTWTNNLSNWTGIPTIISPTPFITGTIPNYNPYTTSHDSVGTNILPGTNNTQSVDYGMQNGDLVTIRADPITTTGNSEKSYDKERLREWGMGEVTSWTGSVMNPVSAIMTDKDVGITKIIYHTGRARYKHEKHDIPTMSYLRESSNSTIIPQGK